MPVVVMMRWFIRRVRSIRRGGRRRRRGGRGEEEGDEDRDRWAFSLFIARAEPEG
jgi:hypothetical protein